MKVRLDQELQKTIDSWSEAIMRKDALLAATLRDHSYRLVLPNGDSLNRDQEIASLSSLEHRPTSVRIDDVRWKNDDRVTVVYQYSIESARSGSRDRADYISAVDFERRDDHWRAVLSRVSLPPAPPRTPNGRESPTRWLRRQLSAITKPSFDELAYAPYSPGQDFSLPRTSVNTTTVDGELPIPPRHLWAGYNYPAHGKDHVDAMLGIAAASGFTMRPGDRVLDFGCAAGRMIRHLQPLASTCEIWGTDISAEHILWCKRNLSPPFRFATTTKVPHLPFEDQSFRFIYCGSVFTHIDDLADAWLLELHRILAPDGRLYVTIHDNRSIEILEESSSSVQWFRSIQTRRVFRESKGSFDVMSIGRGAGSQVFYDRDYFSRMARSAFEVSSITPEAYFYQTAFLLKRTNRPN